MSESGDKNILFGTLALQLDFVTRDQLDAGLSARLAEKETPIGEILVRQQAMPADRRQLLEALVDEHVAKHGGDIEKSLQQLGSIDRLAARELAQLDRTALHRPLNGEPIPENPEIDLYATQEQPGIDRSGNSRFRILRPHRRGGLGEVFVAEDTELSREVALKEIQDRHANNEDSRQRFLREAEITGRLEHPGIVPVYGLGTYDNGRPYYAMRFVRGDSLQDALDKFHANPAAKSAKSYRSGALAIQFRDLLGRFIDVCQAIHYAHSRGVLHRDLKPGNIMLGEYGETLVVDWGLAKTDWALPEENQALDRSLIEPHAGSGSLPTMLGSAVGTPTYMSPEQAAGEMDRLGPTTDVYSLGATLYHVLVGKPPFDSYRDLTSLLQAVKSGELVAPRLRNPAIDRSLEAICLKAMALRPNKRYATAQALAEDVEAYLADEAVSAYAEPITARARRWSRQHPALVTGSAATVMLGLFTAITVAAMMGRHAQQLSFATTKAQSARTEALAAEKLARSSEQAALEEKKRADELAIIATASAKKAEARELEAKQSAEYARQKESEAKALEREAIKSATLAKASEEKAKQSEAEAIKQRSLANDQRSLATQALDAQIEQARKASSVLFEYALIEYQAGRIESGIDKLRSAIDLRSVKDPLRAVYEDVVVDPFFTRGGRSLVAYNHQGVTDMKFSPDGQRIATASWDNTARLWDTQLGTPIGQAMKHKDRVNCVAFSLDGSRVATASDDKSVRLWDAQTGEPLGQPIQHDDAVVWVAFTPEGILTASGNKTQFWDVKSGVRIGQTMNHENNLYCMAFSPDFRRIALAREKSVRLWDIHTGKSAGLPMKHDGYVTSIAFRPDGKRIATASQEKVVRFWDAEIGLPAGQPLKHEYNVKSIAFSPDGSRIATASYDKSVRLWDPETGQSLGEPMHHDDMVNHVVFSPDGSQIATASANKVVRLWNNQANAMLGKPMAHENLVLWVRFSPDGSRIVTASEDNTARLWDAQFGSSIGAPMRHEGLVSCASFSPDGNRIVTASWDGTARLWDAHSGGPMGQPMKHEGYLDFVAFSPDGKRIATASRDGTARLWDGQLGTPVGQLLKHGAMVAHVAFSPDSKRVATASHDNTACLWDAQSGASIGRAMNHDAAVAYVAFSPDGRLIATASGDNTARLWDAQSGEPIGQAMKHEDYVYRVAFSLDGKRIVTGSADNTARLWDAETGSSVGQPMRHEGVVSCVAFSPDGKWIATASWDNTAQLWDAQLGTSIGKTMRHDNQVYCLAFSPDGSRIATASRDKTARLWDIETLTPKASRTFFDRASTPPDQPVTLDSDFLQEVKQYAQRKQYLYRSSAAVRAVAQKNWFTAKFHLPWLIEQEPKRTQWKKLSAQVP